MALAAAPARASTFDCVPGLPFYCQNIHIGCSGRSRRPSRRFRLWISGARGWAKFADGTGIALAVRRYPDAVVLRETGTRNWIRLTPDGIYARRLQSVVPALMTRGRCRQIDGAGSTRSGA